MAPKVAVTSSKMGLWTGIVLVAIILFCAFSLGVKNQDKKKEATSQVTWNAVTSTTPPPYGLWEVKNTSDGAVPVYTLCLSFSGESFTAKKPTSGGSNIVYTGDTFESLTDFTVSYTINGIAQQEVEEWNFFKTGTVWSGEISAPNLSEGTDQKDLTFKRRVRSCP